MKQQFFIPNYEQAQEICAKNDTFYEKKMIVNGVDVSVFNYRLAQFKDFENPIEGNDIIKAYEMRGLMFLHYPDRIERKLALHKFFNINQVPGYQYSDVKDYKVNRIAEKLDGSMIRFVNVNGKVMAKTKNVFDAEQCAMAQNCYEKNEKLKKFIDESLEQGLACTFEVISNYNQIVILYNTTKLVLLQMRDEMTGEYLDTYNHPLVQKYGIECAEKVEEETLDSLLEKRETIEGVEGWIVTFENGIMLKIKSVWYCDLHGLLSDSLARENLIIELIIKDELDDALGNIGEKDGRKIYAEEIQSKLIAYMAKQLVEVGQLKSKYRGDRKEFAIANLKNPLFPITAKLLDVDDYEDKAYIMLKNLVLRETSGLIVAKDFVTNVLGIKVKHLEEQFNDDA